ncbi:hypothetical protein SGRIM128S_03008 [Streptomyces griseomycini]
MSPCRLLSWSSTEPEELVVAASPSARPVTMRETEPVAASEIQRGLSVEPP